MGRKPKILTGCLLFLCLLAFSASSAAQTRTISIQAENQTVASVLKTIEQQSGYTFFYNDAAFDKSRRISISASGKDVLDVVREVFRGTDISASIIEGNIVLSQQPKAAGEQQKAQTGAVTDNNGNFTIPAKEGDVLVVSFLGFSNNEIKVGKQSSYTVALEPDAEFLDDVVVVGYGTQKKVNLTGAVGAISSDVLDNKPIVQASTALQGAIPGVTVTTGGGAPGADTGNIRIRGIGTFGESSPAPLVLIDGIEGNMNSVDASQIDKISVLKDAASSAIYGSRAANGVILITTKRADKGRSSVGYRGYVGWQTPTTTPDTVGPVDYMILNREATENDGSVSIYTDEYISNYLKNNFLDPDNFPVVNWRQHALNGNGLTHNHTLTLNASSGKVRSLTSFGFLSQNGIIKSSDYHRYNFRNNMNVDINDKLEFRFDLSGSFGRRQYSPYQNSFFGFMNYNMQTSEWWRLSPAYAFYYFKGDEKTKSKDVMKHQLSLYYYYVTEYDNMPADLFYVGATYRIPNEVGFLAGFAFGIFQAYYSYDYNFSNLRHGNYGTHEIGIEFKIREKGKGCYANYGRSRKKYTRYYRN